MAFLRRHNDDWPCFDHFGRAKASAEITHEDFAAFRVIGKRHMGKKKPPRKGALKSAPGLAWNRLSGPLAQPKRTRLKPAFAGNETHLIT